MRTKLSALLLVLLIPLLASCKVYYENRITVNGDQSADVVLRVTVDKADLDRFEQKSGGEINLGQIKQRMADLKSQYEQLGFDAQIIDAPGEYGLILGRHVTDGRAFGGAQAGIGPLGLLQQDDFRLDISETAIHFRMTADLSYFKVVGDEVYQSGGAASTNYMHIHRDSYARLVLDLPYPVQKHNASFVSPDARHLEWDLVFGQKNELYADAGREAAPPPAEPDAPPPPAEPDAPPAEPGSSDAPSTEPPAPQEDESPREPAPAAGGPADDGNPEPSVITTVTEQWNEIITERNDEGRLAAFDLAEKNAFNLFGIGDWRFKEYDRPVDRVKKVGYVVLVKWRLMVAEGFAEIGSLLGE